MLGHHMHCTFDIDMSEKLKHPKNTFLICTGKKCGSKGGHSHYKNLRGMIRTAGKKKDVQVIRTLCTGNCKMAPVIGVMPKNKWYGQVNPEKAAKLFKKAAKKD